MQKDNVEKNLKKIYVVGGKNVRMSNLLKIRASLRTFVGYNIIEINLLAMRNHKCFGKNREISGVIRDKGHITKVYSIKGVD